jgi:hypothetical protein
MCPSADPYPSLEDDKHCIRLVALGEGGWPSPKNTIRRPGPLVKRKVSALKAPFNFAMTALLYDRRSQETYARP